MLKYLCDYDDAGDCPVDPPEPCSAVHWEDDELGGWLIKVDEATGIAYTYFDNYFGRNVEAVEDL